LRKNKELPWKLRDHSIFTGYAPYNAPRFAVGCVVEHGGSGSKRAASIALVTLVGLVGVTMIFAATDGVWGRGAQQHLIRLLFAGGLMIGIAMVDVKVWYTLAYPAYLGHSAGSI